jgi:hypothetical protein
MLTDQERMLVRDILKHLEDGTLLLHTADGPKPYRDTLTLDDLELAKSIYEKVYI